MKDYTLIFKAIYIVLSIAISVFILPWLKEWLKAKVGEAKYKRIAQIVDQAVKAFEEIYKTQSGMGPVKKAGVVDFVKEVLSKYGITIDDEFLDKMIEALVFEMNEGKKKNVQ